jgi:hypothetical protein
VSAPWIGVDLDGTLAEYHGWQLNGGVGRPIAPMIRRVKEWRKKGIEVRILTARVGVDPAAYSLESESYADDSHAMQQRGIIEQWCLEHIGEVLPITAQKDFLMLQLWDDRAIRVRENVGIPCWECLNKDEMEAAA